MKKLYRLENDICEIERQHSIIHCMTPDCAEFKEVVKCRSTTTQLKLKSKMEVLARERVFYINTITHHAGIYLWHTCMHCGTLMVFFVYI